jgi:hypothetical protein
VNEGITTPGKKPKRPYYHYGEGSVHHNGNPCPEGIGQRHPQIHREEWPSVWAYRRSRVAGWWAHRKLGRLIWPDGQDETNGTPMAKFRWNPLDKPMLKLFGPAYPRNPILSVGIRNEDSIYDRSYEIEYDRAKADQEGAARSVPSGDGAMLGDDRGDTGMPALGDREGE